MATLHTRSAARLMIAPSVLLLLAWMIVPLAMTIYFSLLRYNLLMPGMEEFAGLTNYTYFLTDPAFFQAIFNTLAIVLGVLFITVVGGIGLALLLDQPMFGQGIVRILVIAPFLIMPTVAALVWKNMFMNPVNGLFAWLAKLLGLQPFDFLANAPLLSIILIVAWQWLPFATLILLTALQSLDEEQKEAAQMDGAGAGKPLHLSRPAASLTGDHGGHPDPDDLPAVGLRRDPRHHQWRSGYAEHESHIPRLRPSPSAVRCGRRLGGRNHRGHPRQHRRILPDAHDRQDAGGLRPMARNVSTGRKLITTVVAWTIGILIFFPILWTFLTSFKTEAQAIASPPVFLFFDWTTENYSEVQSRSDYLKHFMNSVVVSFGSTLLGLLIAIPSAWAMAFSPTKRTKDVLMWMLSTKMMPPVGVLVPMYLIFRNWGLLDTRTGLVIVLTLINLPIIIWMLYTYFKEIPGEILEAARMDGASLTKEIIYVLTPMAIPGIASTLLLNIILAWNEAFWTLNLSAAKAAPLTAFIASYSSPEGLFYAKLSAASTMAIAPILILGWFSQKQLVRGLTFGAVK